MYKNVYYGAEARNILFNGIAKVANAVRVTLGANGRNVVIGKNLTSPHITKDGVTVARNIYLKDYGENTGANLIKEVAGKTVELAGDGTTTATVLALSMITRGIEALNNDVNSVKLKRGMDRGLEVAIEELKGLSKQIEGHSDLQAVATISTNNDPVLGKLIADAFHSVGKTGIVNVDISNNHDTSLGFTKGFKINQGYMNPLFATGNKVTLENPMILLINGRILNYQEIIKILDYGVKKKQQLLIICDGVDDMTMESLLHNKEILKSCVIKPSGYGEDKITSLRDIQAIVGGKIYGTGGESLANVDIDDLGSAATVIVSGTTTEVIGGKGEKANSYIEKVESMLAELTNDFEIDRMKARLSNLKANVATIKIGGYTTTEILEKKDRIDDAIHAVRSALEEGYCYGGGTAYVFCAQAVSKALYNEPDDDIKKGYEIVMSSLISPLQQLLSNSGYNVNDYGTEIRDMNYGEGIDVRTGNLEDFAKIGIYDPTKVLRVALESAVSIAGIFVTTEALITEEE